jgi:hypothetical protein
LITQQVLDGRTHASRNFNAIVQRVTLDLGGPANCSEIERHLITAFAGATILQQHLLAKMLSGATIDPHEFSSTVTSMIRSATRLGTQRRPRDVTPDPLDYAREHSS